MNARRLLLPLTVIALATAVFLFWKWLLLAAIGITAWHVLTRDKRHRPKTSWAKLLEAGALAVVAWNTRHLTAGAPGRVPSKGFTLGLGRRLRRQPENEFPFEDRA